jgi:hypothetical protein
MVSLKLWKGVLAAAVLMAAGSYAYAQSAHDPAGMHGSMPQTHVRSHLQPLPGDMTHAPATIGHQAEMSGRLTLPGQDAFGAIQEIVRILEADPDTDWSKVDLEALRQHLIDMNDVTLKANAVSKRIDGGLEIVISGAGPTVGAIHRMVPAHAQEINGQHGWRVTATSLPDGALLTVTSSDPKEVQHIRGLGFIGILVTGADHQPHHLMMAKGTFQHGR